MAVGGSDNESYRKRRDDLALAAVRKPSSGKFQRCSPGRSSQILTQPPNARSACFGVIRYDKSARQQSLTPEEKCVRLISLSVHITNGSVRVNCGWSSNSHSEQQASWEDSLEAAIQQAADPGLVGADWHTALDMLPSPEAPSLKSRIHQSKSFTKDSAPLFADHHSAVDQHTVRKRRAELEASRNPDPKGNVHHPTTVNQVNTVHVPIGDEDAVREFIKTAFHNVHQLSVKTMMKEWIKEIEPKKQKNFPYKDPSKRPPWWPIECQYKEPDHIKSEDRVGVIISIIECAQDVSNLDLINNKSLEDLEEISLRQGLKFDEQPILKAAYRKDLIKNVFILARAQREWKNGERDPTDIIALPAIQKFEKVKAANKRQKVRPPQQQHAGATRKSANNSHQDSAGPLQCGGTFPAVSNSVISEPQARQLSQTSTSPVDTLLGSPNSTASSVDPITSLSLSQYSSLEQPSPDDSVGLESAPYPPSMSYLPQYHTALPHTAGGFLSLHASGAISESASPMGSFHHSNLSSAEYDISFTNATQPTGLGLHAPRLNMPYHSPTSLAHITQPTHEHMVYAALTPATAPFELQPRVSSMPEIPIVNWFSEH